MAVSGSKLESIQVARAIAACAVVACHLPGFESKYLSGPPVAPSVCLYGMTGVDLYFVISGFIITTISRNQFGEPGQAWRFLVHRAVRIYPTYWVWCLPIAVLFALNPGMVNSSHGRPDVIRSLLLLPQQNLPLLLVSWTLVYEMFFYLLFAGALRWVKAEDLSRVLMAWAAVVVVGNVVLAPSQNEPVLDLTFSPLLLEFIFGCMVALHADSVGRRAAIGSLAIGIAGFVAGTLVLNARDEPFPLGWTRVLIYGVCSTLVVAGLVAQERAGRLKFPRALVALGDASYSLYLSHVPVIGVVGLVWRRSIAAPTPGLHVAALISGFGIALAAGLVSFHQIELPLLRTSRQLARAATTVWVRQIQARTVASAGVDRRRDGLRRDRRGG